jgi:general secretion pathway protein D
VMAGNPLLQLFGGNAALSNTAADIRIVGEESSNTLMVRATAADWALIQQVVQGVDLRPLQVLIEVTIAEVARNNDLNVGVSGLGTHLSGRTADSASFPSAAGARDFILKLTGGNGTIDYNVALNALQSRGDVKVLSLPVVIAQNNKQAILNVGSRVPFVSVSQNITTGTTPTTVQTVQYLDVGTVLTITPTINADGYVNMAVVQTDNSVTTTPQFSNPVINTREATTQVFLRDGQTTVIGGLAGKSTNKTVEGIPILSKIPFVGKWLFAHTVESNSTSELFLFLTPHVIYTDTDIDQLRNAVKTNTDLLKQVPTGARFSPTGDTIRVGVPDSTRRRPDSVTTVRGGRGGRGGGGR